MELDQNSLFVISCVFRPLAQAMDAAALRKSCAFGRMPGFESLMVPQRSLEYTGGRNPLFDLEFMNKGSDVRLPLFMSFFKFFTGQSSRSSPGRA